MGDMMLRRRAVPRLLWLAFLLAIGLAAALLALASAATSLVM